MTRAHLIATSVLALVVAARPATAATFYVAPTGNDGNPGSMASPFRTIGKGASVAQPGDTVSIRGGMYMQAVNVMRSGTAAAWITFSAFPGELPILDGSGSGGTGFSSSTAQYIRVVGIATRNWSSSGFGNGWVNDTGTSNGNWQFINCIADGNGINGITFYNASGLLIDESIVSHNGNMLPSWSSGVNLFHVMGTSADNVVRRTVSFENIDISTNHTDGSGFILDQSSSGATFENNIGFRNGGSCIRINTPGARIINNTCYHDGLASADVNPANPGEIYFSNGPNGAVLANNLATASGWNNTQNAFVNGPAGTNNLVVNRNGPTPFFVDPVGVNFDIVAGSTTVIDQGTATNAPATDIGFDPKCIKAQSGQAVSFWQYAPDYTYIASVGGVAGCFHPKARPQAALPDIGAYEFGGAATGAGGAGAGGTSGTGGVSGTGGAGAGGAGGAMTTGGAGGRAGSGGAGGSSPPTGAGGATGAGTGGSSPASGAGGTGGATGGDSGSSGEMGGSSGCSCALGSPPGGGPLASLLALLGACLAGAVLSSRRRRRG
jgi:hypothetical protein